jgi:hypothetical protein
MEQTTRAKGSGARGRGPKNKAHSEEMILLNPKSEQVSETEKSENEGVSGESKI